MTSSSSSFLPRSAPSQPLPRSTHRPAQKETTTTHTVRPLRYTYIHLHLTQPSTLPQPPPRLDNLTAHSTLQSTLTRFLGLHGSAISIDILHVAAETGEFWIRVPREDGDGVVAAVAAVGGGLRVRGRGEWLGGVVMGGMEGKGKGVWG